MDFSETPDGIVQLFKRELVIARVETPFFAGIQHDKITAEFLGLKCCCNGSGRIIPGHHLRAQCDLLRFHLRARITEIQDTEVCGVSTYCKKAKKQKAIFHSIA